MITLVRTLGLRSHTTCSVFVYIKRCGAALGFTTNCATSVFVRTIVPAGFKNSSFTQLSFRRTLEQRRNKMSRITVRKLNQIRSVLLSAKFPVWQFLTNFCYGFFGFIVVHIGSCCTLCPRRLRFRSGEEGRRPSSLPVLLWRLRWISRILWRIRRVVRGLWRLWRILWRIPLLPWLLR